MVVRLRCCEICVKNYWATKLPAFGGFVPHRRETNLLGLHLFDSLGD